MTMHIFYGLLAVLLGGAGTIHYYIGIFKRQIKPHAFSWVIWALTTIIVGIAQFIEGGGIGAYVTILSSLAATCTACLSLKFGRTDITKSDWVSFIAALCTIPLWLLTQNAFFAVVLVTIIDLFGFYPSFRKGHQKPWDEGAFLFGAVSIKFLLSAFALENFTLVTALYPLALFVINAVFVMMLMIRRRIVIRG